MSPIINSISALHPNRIKERAAEILLEIRQKNPIIHNITNLVAAPFTANALLALGASPVMTHGLEEVGEVVQKSDALVINIGTLDSFQIESMIRASKLAYEKNIPVILDPVGAGLTKFRQQAVETLLSTQAIRVLKGNSSEIKAIATGMPSGRGVESDPKDSQLEEGHLEGSDIQSQAIALAKKHELVVVVSGKIDLITDGHHIIEIHNGQKMMTKITGTGCAMTAIIAAALGVKPDDSLLASATGTIFISLAGELATKGHTDQNMGPGTLAGQLLDALFSLTPSSIHQFSLIKTKIQGKNP